MRTRGKHLRHWHPELKKSISWAWKGPNKDRRPESSFRPSNQRTKVKKTTYRTTVDVTKYITCYRDQTWYSQVPWEVLKTEAEGRGFQHLQSDLANVNVFKNHVRSVLLHKNSKYLLHFALFFALFCFAFSPMSRERYFHGLCSF